MSATKTKTDTQVAVTNAGVPDDFLLQIVRDGSIDAAKLQVAASVYIEMREKQRAWEKQDQAELARLAFFQARAGMQAALPVLDKDTPNQEGKGKFVDFGDLWEACYPVWTTHGFNVSFDVVPSNDGLIWLKLLLDHVQGHREEYLAPPTPPDTTGPKGTINKTIPQGNQATITYLQRGLLTRAIGIAMKREDDDGNSGRRADSGYVSGNLGSARQRASDGWITEDQVQQIDELLKETGTTLQALFGFYTKSNYKRLEDFQQADAQSAIRNLAQKKLEQERGKADQQRAQEILQQAEDRKREEPEIIKADEDDGFTDEDVDVDDPTAAPDPLDETNGRKWLLNLDVALANAQSVDEVVDIGGHASVGHATANAPEHVKRRVSELLAKAYARFTKVGAS